MYLINSELCTFPVVLCSVELYLNACFFARKVLYKVGILGANGPKRFLQSYEKIKKKAKKCKK
jgi:hypothetical protein